MTETAADHELDGDAWEFPARLADDGVVDGDTFSLEVDVGFNMRRRIRVRLWGIDTAEIYGVEHGSEEYERGMEHKAFAEQWFMFEDNARDEEFPLNITTLQEKGKYGRYVAIIRGPEGDSLTAALAEEFERL